MRFHPSILVSALVGCVLLAIAPIRAAHADDRGTGALVGAQWSVADLAGGRVIDGARITMTFDASGFLFGGGSCNRYRASYTVDGQSIRIGPAASTMMACSPALMDQERKFLDLLAAATRFEVTPNGGLRLETQDGKAITATRD